MTEAEVVDAVIEWAVEAVPAVDGNTYAYLPAAKIHGLPDLAVDIVAMRVVPEDPDFAILHIEQTWLRIRDMALSFMVEAPDIEADHEAAQQALRAMVDAICDALLADHTLGGRVPLAAPTMRVDYEPAFVEYSDGTRGREVTIQMSIAEPLVYED